MSLYSLCSTAQNVIPINEPDVNKPRLFQSLPENFPVRMLDITALFGSELGRPVSLSLSDAVAFQFDGNIVSMANKYDNRIKSVVVRSTNFPGASFTISKITDERGTISYTGRILSMQHGDLFELSTVNDQLVFVKRKFYDLVNE